MQTVPTSLPTPATMVGKLVVWVVQTHVGGGDDSENGVSVYASSTEALAAIATEDAEYLATNDDEAFVAEYGTEEPPYGEYRGFRYGDPSTCAVYWEDADGGFRVVFPQAL